MIATLIRTYVRRSRWTLLVWVLGLGLLPAFMAVSARSGYPTQADVSAFVRESMANLSEVALRGPIFGETIGAIVGWTLASSGSLVAGVVALIYIVRYCRGDEQSGRIEMILGTRATRGQQLWAAMATVGLAGVAIGLVTVVGLLAAAMPAAGSALLGLVLCGSTWFFTAVGALVAQIATSPRAAGIGSGVVLGVLFVFAAAGDATSTPLGWLSPFGWARYAETFVADRFWTPLIAVALAVVLALAAAGVNRRRDYATGAIPARGGRPTAAAWIRGPLSLTIRLSRATTAAWGAGMLLLGAIIGSVLPGLDAQLAGTAFEDFAARHGSSSVGNVFFQFVLYVLAQIATAAALAAVLELRADETDGLAELMLSRGVGRTRWAVSRWVVGFGVGVVVLVCLGLGASVSGRVGLAASALVYLPTVAFMVGLALALTGWLPRAAAATSWTVLGVLLFADLLSEFNLVPASVVEKVSPFAATFASLFTGGLPPTLILLSLAGIVLGGIGLLGLSRRDVGV